MKTAALCREKNKGSKKMERNQNGYPTMPRCDGGEMRRMGCGNGCQNGCPSQSRCENMPLDSMPVGYAYVPTQKFRMLYNEENALKHGTLFEELYLPMEVYAK